MAEVDRPPALPAHIDDTVRAIARLHAEHRGEATASERVVERLTGGAGKPRSLVALTALMAGWMGLNVLTQRREDRLAGHREQLTLELGILSEQKAARIIELLEELRRDIPSVRHRVDDEAAAMSTPADPEAILAAINRAHDGMPSTGAEAPSPDRT